MPSQVSKEVTTSTERSNSSRSPSQALSHVWKSRLVQIFFTATANRKYGTAINSLWPKNVLFFFFGGGYKKKKKNTTTKKIQPDPIIY